MSASLDRPSFERVLRTWFDADAAAPATVDHLWSAWQAFAADPARVDGLDSLFQPENARVVHGQAWWEERQKGEPRVVRPVTAADLACMLLATDPRLGPRPRPRPYCPEDLVGTWRLAGVTLDREEPRPPAAERTWTLGEGGAFSSTGQPDRTGATWRVHLGSAPELWLLSPEGLLERFVLLVRGNPMDLRGYGQLRGFERWTRVRPAASP